MTTAYTDASVRPAVGHPDYDTFVERNAGIVSARAQRELRTATVLIAGCGSTGGAAVEPLTRVGVQRFILADPSTFELNNLNRQLATHDEIGAHKAEVAAARVLAINPHAEIEVERGGIASENVSPLVGRADVVIDGVDVTTSQGWEAKVLLHEAARDAGRPVLTGWDMAGTQYVRFYDYRRRGAKPLDGKVTLQAARERSPWELMARTIPVRHVPEEMLREALENLGRPDHSVAQVVYTSEVFGAVVARATAVILEGGVPRRDVVIDLHGAVARGRDRMARRAGLARARLAVAPTVVRLRRGERRV